MGTRINYTQGYVLARRPLRKPKAVPKCDTILLRIRGGRKRHRIDLYLRIDEAVAIITVLGSEVWGELIGG